MGTLTGSLSIALQSLLTQQGALEVTSNNIANANTPGYSRQRPVFAEEPPIVSGQLTFGQGVGLEKVQSIRDNVLELRLNQESGTQSQLDAFLGGLNQVTPIFDETQGSGLQGVITKFFNSFQQLATDPADPLLRQGVVTAGQSLASAFNQASGALSQAQTSLDQSVVGAVTQVNQLTSQIAALNPQIAVLQASGKSSGALEDQRTQLIRQLSGLTDVAVTDAGQGSVTLTTANGAPLVVGNQSFDLTTKLDALTGTQHVFSQGKDITAAIASGQLSGLIQARDQSVASAKSGLDNLAASLNQAVNAQHAKGFDLSGAAGGAFFVPFTPPSPTSNAGAAAQLTVAISDPSKVAASSDGTAGSNGNAQALAALQSAPILNGQNVSDFYSAFVAGIGDQVSSATAQQQAANLVTQQLENQRSNVSGVSLDQEAANLELYQQAYSAAARVVNTIDQMTQTVLAMAPGA